MMRVHSDATFATEFKKSFRELFDSYMETLIYRGQVGTFPDYLHHEMDAVDAKVEHPSVQQKLIIEVLRDSDKLTGFMESLSHLKNEKTMSKIESAPEFNKLVDFLNEFLQIGDSAKAKAYVNHLIYDLKILSLLEMANFSEDKTKISLSKKPVEHKVKELEQA